MHGQVQSIHQFTVETLEGKTQSLSDFKGKKVLIVNTASHCGLTPQFKELEELYRMYSDKGFVVIGFPSNDFAQQEPGDNKEIKSFCERNYGVSFPMMSKVKVKGDSASKIYKWLTRKSQNGVKNSSVKWNFQKYLIDENGHLVDVVAPWRKPTCGRIIRWLDSNK